MKRTIRVRDFVIATGVQVLVVALFSGASPVCKQYVILWMLGPPIALFFISRKQK